MCGVDTPLSQVLARIDASPYLFQIVVDESRRLLGTITDGDIRRAMLHGSSLDTPAKACMHRTPRFGRIGNDDTNQRLLDTLGSAVPFLPLVDADGTVGEILYGRASRTIETALVMAGGLGSRLGERTRNTPKPLLPVGGRPILEHVLTNLESSGVRRIFVSVNYLAEQIKAFLDQRHGSASTIALREQERLGTAGALGLLPPETRLRPVLVVNGDLVTRVDIGALCDFHQRHGLDATVAVSPYHVEIPFGVVRYGADGLFAGIDEKPRLSHFVAAGIYYLTPPVTALVGMGQRTDMPEVLNRAREIGLRIGLFPIHEFWADVGRPDDLDAVNHSFSNGQAAP
jgi:dTDP-glucose pyrophosphorylase